MATRPTDTPAGSPPGGRPHRVLVVANTAVEGDQLVEGISRHTGDKPGAEVRIVAPALGASPLGLAAGDVDDEIAAAGRRLDEVVETLRRQGMQASGEVGEAEPELALQDALVKFPADEVVVIAHPDESADWLEKDLLERVRDRLTVPITYVEVESGNVREVTDVEPAGREVAARRRAEEFDTDYLPPMSTRDRLALAIGPLGTIALWLLASDCHGQLGQDFAGDDAACIVITLLAIFGLIITAIHVPALLLLRSGRGTSRGLARFTSSLMFAYFLPALVAATIIAIAR
jgi:hypothetical protein